MQPSTTAIIISIVSAAISLLALGLAIISLVLQRWDKRPRLKVTLSRGQLIFPTGGPTGEAYIRPLPGFKLVARNPTDKLIKVEEILFVDGRGRRYVLPKEWPNITEVPSHEKREAEISVAAFNKYGSEMEVQKIEKGYFLFVDHLEHKYKTPRLKDASLLLMGWPGTISKKESHAKT